MKKRLMKSLISLLFFLCFNASTHAYSVLPIELDVAHGINNDRAANGLSLISFDNTLFEASRHHAEDMSSAGRLDINLSDGTSFTQNFINFGYPAHGITSIAIGRIFHVSNPTATDILNDLRHVNTTYHEMLMNSGAWSGFEWKGIGVGWSDNYYVVGVGDLRPPPFSVVPMPAASWLFGAGLIGLIGIARRKRA